MQDPQEMEDFPPPTPPTPPPQLRSDTAFNSASSSPYITPPSSPPRSIGGGGFLSAPASPRLASAFFRQFSFLSSDAVRTGAVGPSSPHHFSHNYGSDDEDFEFNFSGHLGRNPAASAADLFDGGKIKPLDGVYAAGLRDSGRGTEKARMKENSGSISDQKQSRRGRPHRDGGSSPPPSSRKSSRSLSPCRVTDLAAFDAGEDSQKVLDSQKPLSPSASSSANSNSSAPSSMAASAPSRGSRKWRLRDLLLFRSASEGHESAGSRLRRYWAPAAAERKKAEEDLRAVSFRSAESSAGSGSGTTRRRSGPGSVKSSAHEVHYKTNRAAAAEMRRRTFLPYKPDLLGCLGFNSVSAVQEMTRGLGSLPRG